MCALQEPDEQFADSPRHRAGYYLLSGPFVEPTGAAPPPPQPPPLPAFRPRVWRDSPLLARGGGSHSSTPPPVPSRAPPSSTPSAQATPTANARRIAKPSPLRRALLPLGYVGVGVLYAVDVDVPFIDDENGGGGGGQSADGRETAESRL